LLQGGLFTRDWLIEGVMQTPAWRALDGSAVASARGAIAARFADLLARHHPNEAETESKLVYPVLGTLGWEHVSVQQRMDARGRHDVPDALLFPDSAADAAAAGLDPWLRFRHGAALLEAKRWNRPLDRAAAGDQGVPAAQLLHYLSRADVITQGKMRWGMLTNGRHWRLYWQGALSVADDYLEIDLGKALALPGCEADLLDAEINGEHAFKLFLLLFGREAFLPQDQGRSFHDAALAEARQWEERVARDLADVVFARVFPLLVIALPQHDREKPADFGAEYAEAVRHAALILLYRLLFVLYAEDRNLLPDERGPYAEFALTRMRGEIADRKLAGAPFAARSVTYWSRLETIFGAIADGDDALGIPPYNGGLFDPAAAPLLGRVRLPDTVAGEVIFLLSHRPAAPRPRYINYRDLSVQQLGSVYEALLEYAVEPDGEGGVRPRGDNSARHRSGSYYTPEELVALIIARAVGPLVEERRQAFVEAFTGGKRGEELAALDPATRLLDLKIVDPAMGSGHFLVSLVDWLSDKVLTAIGDAEAIAGPDYLSPLVTRIAALRADILARAAEHRWPIVAEQLDDPQVVRRMVLKRCVYGVDLNPMAVELAKVALWLHSFTVGAPLSFLDHHLRCGNSVLGAWVRPVEDMLLERGTMFLHPALAQARQAAIEMAVIEGLSDNDTDQVRESKARFAVMGEETGALDAFMRYLEAFRLVSNPKDWRHAAVLGQYLDAAFGDPVALAGGQVAAREPMGFDFAQGGAAKKRLSPADGYELFRELDARARAAATEQRFFNWQPGFPGVWTNWSSTAPEGGFDAVIGNPPYVRQEMIASIKPALERYAAYAGTADLYVYFYEQGLKLLRPGGRMGYVVTNKWLKAGYAEGLRRLFAGSAWVEFLADFGHAKRFFPDADVFPSVLVARKPVPGPAPDTFDLTVIPRDDVPRAGLDEAVRAASYAARRDTLTAEPWTLEPPDVAALLAKLRTNGVPLVEYAGVRPLYGIKTGFNEAFLIDTATKERLIAEDGRAAEIIKPYLRGQDIDRWLPSWAGLWMIFARRGVEIENYPSILRHLEGYRAQLEPKPVDWKPIRKGEEWPGRKAGTYAWYEIQDAVDYFAEFSRPKLLIKMMAYNSRISIDNGQYLTTTLRLSSRMVTLGCILSFNRQLNGCFSTERFPTRKTKLSQWTFRI